MIKLFNTFGRQKEDFKPIVPHQVGIYSCGPTVYDYPHIGNLRAYVFADTLHRLFLYNNFTVKHIINITDVGHLTDDSDSGQDKIELTAQKTGQSAKDISEKYTAIFLNNLKDLNINAEQYQFPKASEHIDEQIALIAQLVAKGFTYETKDGLYFNIAKYPSYADLAKLNLNQQETSSRTIVNNDKINPADFALWKFSDPQNKRQQEWPSPWGVGWPGWHIECSAMSMKYLGDHFDIHTGGIDHIPTHHTNERAQSEAVTGKTLTNYWLHNGFVTIKDNKMAKSDGNFLTLENIKDKGYSPLSLRYLFLNTHYRKDINFSDEALKAADNALLKLYHFMIEASQDTTSSEVVKSYQEKFIQALNDDLNTPLALAIVWEVINNPTLSNAEKKAILIDFDKVLGLDLPIKWTIKPEVKTLIEQREKARGDQDWALADEYRQQIETAGFIVKDTPTGGILLPKTLDNQ